MTDRPLGVNVFAPVPVGGPETLGPYASRLADWTEARGLELGSPRNTDDDYAAKVDPGESDLALEAGADALVDEEAAPTAYPEIHYLTAPMRKACREAGDAEVINLWAGEAHSLGREIPAARLVRELAADAARAAAAAATRLAT